MRENAIAGVPEKKIKLARGHEASYIIVNAMSFVRRIVFLNRNDCRARVCFSFFLSFVDRFYVKL